VILNLACPIKISKNCINKVTEKRKGKIKLTTYISNSTSLVGLILINAMSREASI
jgi:hypothetical protein